MQVDGARLVAPRRNRNLPPPGLCSTPRGGRSGPPGPTPSGPAARSCAPSTESRERFLPSPERGVVRSAAPRSWFPRYSARVRRILLIVVLVAVALLAGLSALPLVGRAPDLSVLPPRDTRGRDRRRHRVERARDRRRFARRVGARPAIQHRRLGGPARCARGARPSRRRLRPRRLRLVEPSADRRRRATRSASNARELGALLDQLGIARAALVGWSYGGGIVQTFALEHPDRVSRARAARLGRAPRSATSRPTSSASSAARRSGPPVFRYDHVGRAARSRRPRRRARRRLLGPRERSRDGWVDRSAAQMALPGTVDSWLAEERHARLRGAAARGDQDADAGAARQRRSRRAASPSPRISRSACRMARLVVVEGGSHMLPVDAYRPGRGAGARVDDEAVRRRRAWRRGRVVALLACSREEKAAAPAPEPPEPPVDTQPIAVLRVRDMGEIRIALRPDVAPQTVANFEKLAGEHFYDGILFHRVIPDFMIQTGDPLSKDRDPRNDGLGRPRLQDPRRDRRTAPSPRRRLDGEFGTEHRRLPVLHHWSATRRISTRSTPSSGASSRGWKSRTRSPPSSGTSTGATDRPIAR